jgi:hypothetical protein
LKFSSEGFNGIEYFEEKNVESKEEFYQIIFEKMQQQRYLEEYLWTSVQ